MKVSKFVENELAGRLEAAEVPQVFKIHKSYAICYADGFERAKQIAGVGCWHPFRGDWPNRNLATTAAVREINRNIAGYPKETVFVVYRDKNTERYCLVIGEKK